MRVALTGASGLIGSALRASLVAEGHRVRLLGRRAGPPDGWQWDALAGAPPVAALADADAVVHLLGEPIARRWTAAAWERIVASRVDGTRRLLDTLSIMDRKPAVLLCASAIGIYGDRGDEVLREGAVPGGDRVARLCVEWEREAMRAGEMGIRVVLLRTGLVLSAAGGALARMLPAFRLGLGGRLGDGRQWVSWIHLRDLVRLVHFALEHPDLRGPVNGTAPEPVLQRDFARALGRTLCRPAILPVPRLALRLLFGEMAGILTASQRVLPEVAREHGFHFEWPELSDALSDLLA